MTKITPEKRESVVKWVRENRNLSEKFSESPLALTKNISVSSKSPLAKKTSAPKIDKEWRDESMTVTVYQQIQKKVEPKFESPKVVQIVTSSKLQSF